MTTKEQKQLEQTEEGALATMPEQEEPTALATTEEIDNMFGGSGYQIPIDAPLPQVEILREIPQFKTPEGATVKTIVGHIIYWHHANQYYDSEFGEGEQGPPKCASPDGIKPMCTDEMEPQADVCRTCPKNQYGSADEGKGKACQNTIRLYVLAEGEVIPCLIKASPASLGKKESLMKWLTNAPNVAAKAGAGTKYQLIEVEFSLRTKDFESGFKASVLSLDTLRVLDPKSKEDMVEIVKLGNLYSEFMANYIERIGGDVASEQLVTDEDEAVGTEDEIPI